MNFTDTNYQSGPVHQGCVSSPYIGPKTDETNGRKQPPVEPVYSEDRLGPLPVVGDEPSKTVLIGNISRDGNCKLYCVLISMHGLVRGEQMELGRDADTGGQVKYVVQFAKTLANNAEVHRVDLLTRYISDPSVAPSYAQEEEALGEGAFISRIRCGDPMRYIRKEDLWEHVAEFAANGTAYIRNRMHQMSMDGVNCAIHCIHGHYADSGEAAILIAKDLGVDVVFTAHSLGLNKLQSLLLSGVMTEDEIEKNYNIKRRLEAEDKVLAHATLMVSSTLEEVEQWQKYNRTNTAAAKQPFMAVIVPGIELCCKLPRLHNVPPIWSDIFRFLENPMKPIVLVLCRPDVKKNIFKLITIFGKSKRLQSTANLVLVLGNRSNIENLPSSSRALMTKLLLKIDKYDLYGNIAYPKHYNQSDVSDLYMLARSSKGVFANVALHEPFGLTLIEAASYGVPVIATKNGGPQYILEKLKNGILVDPTDRVDIENALLALLTNNQLWNFCSYNGRERVTVFSWEQHSKTYLEVVEFAKVTRKKARKEAHTSQ